MTSSIRSTSRVVSAARQVGTLQPAPSDSYPSRVSARSTSASV